MSDKFDTYFGNSASDVSRKNDIMDRIKRNAHSQAQWEHSRDQAVLDAAQLLQKLDQKLDEERLARQAADLEQTKLTVRWNKINLTVGIAGVAVGIAGVIVAIVALFHG